MTPASPSGPAVTQSPAIGSHLACSSVAGVSHRSGPPRNQIQPSPRARSASRRCVSAAGGDTVGVPELHERSKQEMLFYCEMLQKEINDTLACYELRLFLKDLVPLSAHTVGGLSVVYDKRKILSVSFDG